MKVSELQGSLLDYWVAKTEGYVVEREQDMQMIKGGRRILCGQQSGQAKRHEYAPSTNGAHGSQILDREIKSMHCDGGKMMAIAHDGRPGWGKTYLEAGCRAFVASVYGDEVPDMEEPQ